ncbi:MULTISPECIES: hypothetical protein, partial [unclassified Caballeronia]|uniref:hypothetical protein n=1 Tax=unclassified Caballeronia TaxID=2646786 RepID=UPI002028FC9B
RQNTQKLAQKGCVHIDVMTYVSLNRKRIGSSKATFGQKTPQQQDFPMSTVASRSGLTLVYPLNEYLDEYKEFVGCCALH